MLKKLFYVLLTAFIFLTGCQANQQKENQEDTVTISTTIFALEDFISKIGGEYVDVESIYPPNADAHTYEPSSREMVELAQKDAFLYSGVGMEPFAKKAEEILADEDVLVVPLGEGIHLRGEHNHHHDEGDHHGENKEGHDHDHESDGEDLQDTEIQQITIEGLNDHYHSGDTVKLQANVEADTDYNHWHWYTRHDSSEEWEVVDDLSDSIFESKVEEEIEVKAALFDNDHNVFAESKPIVIHVDNHDGDSGDGDPHVFIDPILSIQLAENIKDTLIEILPEQEEYFTENYEELISQLEKVDQDLQQVFNHADHPYLIVSHAAYGYWEDRYGLEQISIHGLSPTQEPSQSELVQIIDAANEHNLNYVAFESNVSSTVSEIIQSEIGAESITLRNMETITQEDIDNDEDYFSLMEKNISALEKALSN